MRSYNLYKLIICLILVSCGKVKPQQTAIPDHLTQKSKLYCDLAYNRIYKKSGYVHSRCDGSGFTSLWSVGCPHLDIDLSVFSDDTGKLHRDPKHSCYPDGSKSESSKDMVLMRMTAAWYHKDRAWVDSFFNFAKKNNWFFCEAVDLETKMSRCLMSYGLITLLHDMRNKLSKLPYDGGPEDVENETLPNNSKLSDTYKSEDSVWDGITKEWQRVGFRAHLDVLRIDLSGEVYGYISNSQKNLLKKIADREENNALYQAMWAKWGKGSYDHVFNLLSDEKHWPSDRLPNNHKNHCTGYLYQRDEYIDGVYNPDWKPCSKEKYIEHSATEFGLSLSKIVLL